MIRTTAVRNLLVRGTSRHEARTCFLKAFSVECVRKKSSNTKGLFSRTNQSLQWEPRLARFYADYPTHIKVSLPALSPTMEEGTIISWAKKEGDKLNEGDLLAEIETDKATMAFETPEEGYLAKILIAAGTKGIPVGRLVCIIVEKQEDVGAFKDFKDDGAAIAPKAKAPSAPSAAAPAAAAPPPAAAPATAAPPQPISPADPTARVYASPMAKRLAEQRQIRLQGKGTGLFGSITSKDLGSLPAGAAAAAPSGKPGYAVPTGPIPGAGGAPSAFVDLPVSGMRATIAKRLLQSKQTIPHFYVSGHINVDKLLAARAIFNKSLEKDKIKISVNDLIIKACAFACMKVPEANSYWLDTVIRQHTSCDVSVAVSTDKGLITPIVFEANRKGLVTISQEVKALAAKARAGKLQPAEYQGGTFTISNLGMFNTTNFSAIINPPQSCILAVGTSTKTLIPDNSPKGFTTANMMWVTLSADHRVVDGAVAAQWMQVFTAACTNPETMLL
nr:dihydrolipoyllysine-residue acetyltransferase component of pyruvate dehydrogenase complex, mitochondrial isoform X1 [Onthophagus taurus]